MGRQSRGRSTRSHVVELVLVLAAVGILYLFLTNGGPSWAGDMIAPLFTP